MAQPKQVTLYARNSDRKITVDEDRADMYRSAGWSDEKPKAKPSASSQSSD